MLNEEDTARAFCQRVCSALATVPWELIVVDDGSDDKTPEILAELAEADQRIKIVTLSRNFGHQIAITAGLEHAAGSVVVMIDADLQDPPELIPTMVDHWRAGSDVVYTTRIDRDGESRFKLRTAAGFYRLMSRVADVPLGQNAGDFRLLDRVALDALLSMRERNRYLRGMTVWIGLTQTAVPYHRDPRRGGASKYAPGKMIHLAFDALASFSSTPLLLGATVGVAIAVLAFLTVAIVVGSALLGGSPLSNVSTVVLMIVGAVQLGLIAIIAAYVARVYDEVKDRPLYVVRRVQNIRDVDDAAGKLEPGAGTPATRIRSAAEIWPGEERDGART
jgi:dolichol-phosphate mannosyltransferase